MSYTQLEAFHRQAPLQKGMWPSPQNEGPLSCNGSPTVQLGCVGANGRSWPSHIVTGHLSEWKAHEATASSVKVRRCPARPASRRLEMRTAVTAA